MRPPRSPDSLLETDALQKRSLIWLAIGLAMLVIVGMIAAWSLRQVNTSDYWVDHTREVISNNQQLLSDVKDAETAERGYIITGDESYLEPYNPAAADISQTVARLQQLMADNPGQQRRIENLERLIAQRMAVLNQAVQRRRDSGFEAAQKVVVAGQGRAVMKQIRDASRQIETEEYRLLQERSRLRQIRIRNGFIATLAASLLALVALLSATFDVRRAVRQRDLAQRSRQESESTTHALFESASQAIFIVDRSGRIVMANPATEKMFGYPASELLGQSVDALVPDQLRGVHAGHRQRYFASPQSRPMGLGLDLQGRRKDGTEFFAEISLSYIETAQGTLGVAFVTDISKRRADEEAIRQQGDELRRLAGRLMTAQDDERRRIARDLHDDLSQKLAYLAMDLGKLATKPSAQELLGDVRPLQLRAAEAAESVRRISHQLHPSILDDIGLEAALEQYCEEFEERSGIATEFTSRSVPESLPQEIASSVYHIFQECLRNVSKHSQAQAVSVTLEVVENTLRLRVRDEGVGLSAERLQAGVSIGIVGMKERAHLVNGKLSIQSQSGQGTEVSVEVPLSPAA
jgi:PAS domain S-box-containing protein